MGAWRLRRKEVAFITSHYTRAYTDFRNSMLMYDDCHICSYLYGSHHAHTHSHTHSSHIYIYKNLTLAVSLSSSLSLPTFASIELSLLKSESIAQPLSKWSSSRSVVRKIFSQNGHSLMYILLDAGCWRKEVEELRQAPFILCPADDAICYSETINDSP